MTMDTPWDTIWEAKKTMMKESRRMPTIRQK